MTNLCKNIPVKMSNLHFTLIILNLFIIIHCSSGLQCYSCIYERLVSRDKPSSISTKGDIRCKTFSEEFFKLSTPIPLIPCNTEADAVNYLEVQQLKADAPYTFPVIPANFRLTCLSLGLHKRRRNSDPYAEVDLVARGCYAKRLPAVEEVEPDSSEDLDWGEEDDENVTTTTTPPTTTTPLPQVECDAPSGSLWTWVKNGSAFNNTQIDTNSVPLRACLCDTGDGCNAGDRVQGALLLIVVLSTILFFIAL